VVTTPGQVRHPPAGHDPFRRCWCAPRPRTEPAEPPALSMSRIAIPAAALLRLPGSSMVLRFAQPSCENLRPCPYGADTVIPGQYPYKPVPCGQQEQRVCGRDGYVWVCKDKRRRTELGPDPVARPQLGSTMSARVVLLHHKFRTLVPCEAACAAWGSVAEFWRTRRASSAMDRRDRVGDVGVAAGSGAPRGR